MTVAYTFLSSPFGRILVAWGDAALVRVGIRGESEEKIPAEWRFEPDLECDATRQLREYFAGGRRSFELPVRLEGTPFRNNVWRALERIPFGETVSYRQVGEWIGSVNASRAVGLACAANPLPIVIPCHRVIGSGGKLVGFGGGLEMKRAMLVFERSLIPAAQAAGSLGL